MRITWELPVEEAAIRISRRPKIVLDSCHLSVGLHQWLLKRLVKFFVFGKPILQIGINSLNNRKIIAIVIPERPTHKVFNPLWVDSAELTFHLPDEIAVSPRSEVHSGA